MKTLNSMYQSGFNQGNITSRRYILREYIKELTYMIFGGNNASLKSLRQAFRRDRLEFRYESRLLSIGRVFTLWKSLSCAIKVFQLIGSDPPTLK